MTRSSLTAKTESVVRYGSSFGKIWVVQGRYPSAEIFGRSSVRTCAQNLTKKNGCRRTHHQMDMGGTHGVAVEPTEHLSGGTVGGQRVCRRAQAVEVVLAVGVATELAAQVVVDLALWVLEVVLAVGRGLPDVDDGVGDALARLRVCDLAVGECDEPARGGAHYYAFAELAPWSVWTPEGTEDGGRGGDFTRLRGYGVSDFVDEAGRGLVRRGCCSEI